MTTYLHQFSGDEAGETLAIMLARLNNKYLTSKVARVINHHNTMLGELKVMKTPTYRRHLARILTAEVNTRTWPGVPEEAHTFMRNIMIAKIRDTLIRGR